MVLAQVLPVPHADQHCPHLSEAPVEGVLDVRGEGGGGLVEEGDPRTVEEEAHEGQALHLAGGEGVVPAGNIIQPRTRLGILLQEETTFVWH